jgi:hypothetical protein
MRDLKVIYVNGIKTSEMDAMSQASELEFMLGKDVELFYNKTNGWVSDLIESFANRWFYKWFVARITLNLVTAIRVALSIGCDVMIVAHSQGTAIAANAIHLLEAEWGADCPYPDRVSLICFANVNSREPNRIKRVEYFINSWDAVLKLLIKCSTEKWIGKRFLRKGSGHNFIHDYLEKIDRFDNVWKSFFYEYVEDAKRRRQERLSLNAGIRHYINTRGN